MRRKNSLEQRQGLFPTDTDNTDAACTRRSGDGGYGLGPNESTHRRLSATAIKNRGLFLSWTFSIDLSLVGVFELMVYCLYRVYR